MTFKMPMKDLHSARTRRRPSTTRDLSFTIVGESYLGGFFLGLFGISNITSSASMHEKLHSLSTDEMT